jgi:hypothetical protein
MCFSVTPATDPDLSAVVAGLPTAAPQLLTLTRYLYSFPIRLAVIT